MKLQYYFNIAIVFDGMNIAVVVGNSFFMNMFNGILVLGDKKNLTSSMTFTVIIFHPLILANLQKQLCKSSRCCIMF